MAMEMSRATEYAKGSQQQVAARHDKLLNQNDRWKAREKSKLDVRAAQLNEEREAMNRERSELHLQENALQRRGEELERKLMRRSSLAQLEERNLVPPAWATAPGTHRGGAVPHVVASRTSGGEDEGSAAESSVGAMSESSGSKFFCAI
mgnify:CR=1 FL=1